MHYYEACVSPFVYEGSVKDSVLRFKYSKRAEYAKFFSEAIFAFSENNIKSWNIDLIVPVPIHPSRKRKRGYNQAELLAKELSRLLNIEFDSDVIRRVKKTKPQKELKNRERIQNLLEAFEFNKKKKVKGNILVVDDIYTTGSTIDSMAIILKKNGCKNVYAVCISAGKVPVPHALH